MEIGEKISGFFFINVQVILMGNFMGNPNLPLIVKISLVDSFKHDMKVVGENIFMAKNMCMCARPVSYQLPKQKCEPVP
jgi:hypothetical protein